MREDGLVPGISAFGLVPVGGTVALARWPIEQRVVGSCTARIAYLRTLFEMVRDEASAASIVAQYAGGMDGRRGPGQLLDLARVRTAVRDELGLLESVDLEERLSAAARLAVLPERYRLWGRPALIAAPTDRGRSIA